MAKLDPVGTVNTRADGGVWSKTANLDWKQIGNGGPSAGSGSAATIPTLPAGTPGAATPDISDNPWAKQQIKYGLDGHMPDPTIHPQHVEIDTEGDIDTKPVMQWQDATGRSHRAYTMAFHRHRALDHHSNIKKLGLEAFRNAHEHLRTQIVTGSSPRARDAAAAALIHLKGGHRVAGILGAHAMNVSTTLPHQGGEAPESGTVLDDGTGTEVAQSATDQPDHQHRTHIVLEHPDGHMYSTSTYDADLAEHMRKRVAERSDAKQLFDCSPEDVTSALGAAGLPGATEGTIRHHAAMHMAADKLSKLPQVDMSGDYATGIQQVMTNLQLVGDEIGAHFGHEASPAGMSYVPPTLVAAYVEESGGAKHWPKAFGGNQEIEQACTSQSAATQSSSAESAGTSALSGKASTSHRKTSRPPPRTRTPSQRFSPKVALQPQHLEVSQAVEVVSVPIEDHPVIVGPAQVAREEHPFVGHVCFQGFDIDLENLKGSTRSGEDARGIKWSCLMHAHYGEFRTANGMDGDKLDVYVGPLADSPLVVVVHQRDPRSGEHDEDKVMLGFRSPEEAVETYGRQYTHPGFYGGSTLLSIAALDTLITERGLEGRKIEGVLSDPGPVSIQVAHAVPMGDDRLRTHLHQVIGTHVPDKRQAGRKRLAEKALARAVARVRDGTLPSEDLARAYNLYKRDKFAECYSALSLMQSAGAGSAGSTGAAKAGSASAGKSSAGSASKASAGGAGPGPDGLPVGSITVLGDGTREQKVGPGEWRRLGAPGEASKKDDSNTPKSSPTVDSAEGQLHQLRQRRSVATSPAVKHELDLQIELIRQRLSKLRKGLGREQKTAVSDQARAKQGQSAAKPQNRELAQSTRALAEARTLSLITPVAKWFSSLETSLREGFDKFISDRDTLFQVQIDLAQAAPEIHVQMNELGKKLGVHGLEQYIVVRLGGRDGS